jgi:hypothetical protein
MPLVIGTRLGSYEGVALLGKGGMGARGHAARERCISVRSRRGGVPNAAAALGCRHAAVIWH